jgi:hypothetical protein
VHDWLFVGVGYTLTFATIGAYAWSLHRRGRRLRAWAVAARRGAVR